jgi:hypothetical protein
MYKENNTKIKNIEEYKKSLTSYRAKLSLAKKVYDSTRTYHNSCLVTNINICKYMVN